MVQSMHYRLIIYRRESNYFTNIGNLLPVYGIVKLLFDNLLKTVAPILSGFLVLSVVVRLKPRFKTVKIENTLPDTK